MTLRGVTSAQIPRIMTHTQSRSESFAGRRNSRYILVSLAMSFVRHNDPAGVRRSDVLEISRPVC